MKTLATQNNDGIYMGGGNLFRSNVFFSRLNGQILAEIINVRYINTYVFKGAFTNDVITLEGRGFGKDDGGMGVLG